VNHYFKQKHSAALGIAVCGSGLGTMIFPWIMPYIIHSPMWFDYDGALLTQSAIIFMCVIFGILMVIFEAIVRVNASVRMFRFLYHMNIVKKDG